MMIPMKNLALAVLLPLAMTAQESSGVPHRPVVRASGEATISAKPDRAQIDIGVVTQARTADAAAFENGNDTNAVLAKVKAALGTAGEVRTINYSLSPAYDYPKAGHPVITGYNASNTVQVTIDDLSKVGKVIDAATSAGSNAINGIRFLLRNDDSVRAEALREAAQKAKTNAEAIARALGLRVTGVLSAEASSVPTPRPMMAMAARASSGPPIESGNIEVQASVVVTLEVAP